MASLESKDYLAVVQCHIVKQRCSGYSCERAFHERTGGFAEYPKDKAYRMLYLTCGGCCGQAIYRKLGHLLRKLKKQEKIEKDRIVVQLSSCITRHNHHGPPCPHLDLLKDLIGKLGVDVREDTLVNPLSEQRRQEGLYATVD